MAQHTELLARYRHLREVGLQLNNRLVKTLPRDVVREGSKRLGILKKNTLVFDSEHEMAVLMDYCIHDLRQQGVNAIERFLATSPPPPDSEEMAVLQAKRQAYYSLFAVEATEPGVGIRVHDLLREEDQFLVDVGLSQTVPIGGLLASRVMVQEEIAMSTGAVLPLGQPSEAELARFLKTITTYFVDMDFCHPSPEQASALATVLIRAALQEGAGKSMRYTDQVVGMGPNPRPAAHSSGRRDRGDRPCPCGSGKRYKKCCGARG